MSFSEYPSKISVVKKKMANTIIEAFVMSAVKRSLGKNLELFFGKKVGIKRKPHVTYVGSEAFIPLK